MNTLVRNTWQAMKKMLSWLLTGNFKCGLRLLDAWMELSVKSCYGTFTQTTFLSALIAFETCFIFTNQELFLKQLQFLNGQKLWFLGGYYPCA